MSAAMKEVQEKLEERERQLSTLLENMPGVAYRCDVVPRSGFSVATVGCQELFGQPAESLTKEPSLALRELIHPDDRSRVSGSSRRRSRRHEAFHDRVPGDTCRMARSAGSRDLGIGVYESREEAIASRG